MTSAPPLPRLIHALYKIDRTIERETAETEDRKQTDRKTEKETEVETLHATDRTRETEADTRNTQAQERTGSTDLQAVHHQQRESGTRTGKTAGTRSTSDDTV